MNKSDRIEEEVSKLNEETQIHSKRVGMYTQVFCRLLGLDDKSTEHIVTAAITHDVGKQHIPKEVLEKEDDLTNAEYNLIKTHAQLGHDELLKQKDVLNQTEEQFAITLDVALSHHEKFNGKGYPNGLKGNEISTHAQIVSVIDVFDAISCKRVYKDAWEKERIEAHYEKEKNAHFNPALVEIFLDNKETFYQLKDYIGNQKSKDIDVAEIQAAGDSFISSNKISTPNKTIDLSVDMGALDVIIAKRKEEEDKKYAAKSKSPSVS